MCPARSETTFYLKSLRSPSALVEDSSLLTNNADDCSIFNAAAAVMTPQKKPIEVVFQSELELSRASSILTQGSRSNINQSGGSEAK